MVPFLIEKARRYGYSVLEDVELVTLCLFGQDASTAIEKSVAMMEGLREVGGPDFLDNVARELQPQGPGAASWHANRVVPAMASVPGLDAHALMVPKGRVSADFIESVRLGDRLVLAIGDAPGYGLKSTFTARFIATMFRRLVEAAHPLNLGDVLSELSRALARQCVLPAGIDAVRRARARRRDHGPRICGASLCNAVLGETRPMRSPARARAAIARRGRGRGRGLRVATKCGTPNFRWATSLSSSATASRSAGAWAEIHTATGSCSSSRRMSIGPHGRSARSFWTIGERTTGMRRPSMTLTVMVVAVTKRNAL